MIEIINNRVPTVSVFMPTYNQGNLIAESIESVIKQTYADWELVIGDDCSTDNTYEIALAYQKRFPAKVRVYKNNKNLGVTGNSNEILRKCKGKYIAFSAGDDVYHEEKLEKQVLLMESDKKIILSYHDIEVFSHETGQLIKYWNHGEKSNKPVVGSTRKLAKNLVISGTLFLGALSVMARRDSIPTWGFDARVRIASDWMMWVDICATNSGRVEYMPDVLARYRKHSGGITSRNSNNIRQDNYVTLGLIECRYPYLSFSVQKRRVLFKLIDGFNEVKDGRPVVGLLLFFSGVIYFPFIAKEIISVILNRKW